MKGIEGLGKSMLKEIWKRLCLKWMWKSMLTLLYRNPSLICQAMMNDPSPSLKTTFHSDFKSPWFSSLFQVYPHILVSFYLPVFYIYFCFMFQQCSYQQRSLPFGHCFVERCLPRFILSIDVVKLIYYFV